MVNWELNWLEEGVTLLLGSWDDDEETIGLLDDIDELELTILETTEGSVEGWLVGVDDWLVGAKEDSDDPDTSKLEIDEVDPAISQLDKMVTNNVRWMNVNFMDLY